MAGHNNPMKWVPGPLPSTGDDRITKHLCYVRVFQPLNVIGVIEPFFHLLEYELEFTRVACVALTIQSGCIGVDALHGFLGDCTPHVQSQEDWSAKHIPVWQVIAPETACFQLAVV